MIHNRVEWQDRFNIGVDFIDREHRKLFSIVNKLFAYDGNDSKSQWAYQEGIKFFKGHAMKHFAEEELNDLKNSIAEYGVLQPIIVKKDKSFT